MIARTPRFGRRLSGGSSSTRPGPRGSRRGSSSCSALSAVERRVARAAPILLEQQHLLEQIARRLAAQVGISLGRIALALRPVADRALGAPRCARAADRVGRRRTAWARGGARRSRRRRRRRRGSAPAWRRAPSRSRPLAARVVLDLLLQVCRVLARDDRHRARAAIARQAVAGRAGERLGAPRSSSGPAA